MPDLACVLPAEPLFEERKAVVTGAKDVPAEAAAPMEGAGEPKEEKPDQDKEPVLPGIPEFWLNALRANAMVADHVRALSPQPTKADCA